MPLISSFAQAHEKKSCTQGLRCMKLYWLEMFLRSWLARGLYASDFDSFEWLSGIAYVPSGVGGWSIGCGGAHLLTIALGKL